MCVVKLWHSIPREAASVQRPGWNTLGLGKLPLPFNIPPIPKLSCGSTTQPGFSKHQHSQLTFLESELDATDAKRSRSFSRLLGRPLVTGVGTGASGRDKRCPGCPHTAPAWGHLCASSATPPTDPIPTSLIPLGLERDSGSAPGSCLSHKPPAAPGERGNTWEIVSQSSAGAVQAEYSWDCSPDKGNQH